MTKEELEFVVVLSVKYALSVTFKKKTGLKHRD